MTIRLSLNDGEERWRGGAQFIVIVRTTRAGQMHNKRTIKRTNARIATTVTVAASKVQIMKKDKQKVMAMGLFSGRQMPSVPGHSRRMEASRIKCTRRSCSSRLVSSCGVDRSLCHM